MQDTPPFNNEPEKIPPASTNAEDQLQFSTSPDDARSSLQPASTPPSELSSAEAPASEPASADVPTEVSQTDASAQEEAVVPPDEQPRAAVPASRISDQMTQRTSPTRPLEQMPPVTQTPQPGIIPVTPQPVLPPGYASPPQGYPVSQNYVRSEIIMPPGGYIPTTPQPGYIPQPGFIPHSGYVPPQSTLPPGYFPPPELTPRPPRPPVTRDKTSLLAIIGVGLAVLILLGIILGVVTHQGGNGGNVTTVTPPPAISTAPTSSLGKPTSAFQATNCPFEPDPTLIQDQQLACGFVTVPENRGIKNGAKVHLAVAIFKANQYITTPDPDPVIRLDGGPGGPSLSGWAQAVTSGNYRDFIFNHDVVMFDQRGTGFSTPSLNCPELLSYQDASKGGGVAYEQAAHACYNRLAAQGIDLGSFNSLENAADVADIIHALGYQQMTLYGVSYGTRLALTTMRLYPSVVHAAVLDSVYPPNHNRADLPAGAQRVFDVLFQGCAKDPTCNTKYPNLQTVFYNLVDQLNAHPASFYTVDANNNQQYTVTFAGDDLISWVFSALYATQLIPAIPKIIYEVKSQQYFDLAQLYSILVFDDTLSQGLFYSDECYEDWPYLTSQNITQSMQGIEPHLARVFGQEGEQQEYDICQFWKVGKAPAAQKQPVVSTIPTLITTGEYDPITPPANGQEAAKTLSHSYFFEFPGQGHGQLYSSSCSNQIISAFDDNPLVQPDGSCISMMTEPQFV